MFAQRVLEFTQKQASHLEPATSTVETVSLADVAWGEQWLQQTGIYQVQLGS